MVNSLDSWSRIIGSNPIPVKYTSNTLKYFKKHGISLINRRKKKRVNRKIWIKRVKVFNYIGSIKFKLLIYFFNNQRIKLNKKMVSSIAFEEKAVLFIFNYWLFLFYHKFY